MMTLDYTNLFEPYMQSTTLAKVAEWLIKRTGASPQIIEVVIAETAIELANGKTFSTTGCDCGCEMTLPNVAIEHYMMRQVYAKKQEVELVYVDALQANLRAMLVAYMHKENEQYLVENSQPARLLDWDKSWLIKGVRKLHGLVSGK